MSNTQSNNVPNQTDDRRDFEEYLKLPLKYLRGMLLFDYRRVSDKRIRDAEDKYGRHQAQAYLNHVHLVTCSEDPALQRQWAYELIDSIRQRAKALCPNVMVVGQIEDVIGDITVTFWAVDEGCKGE